MTQAEWDVILNQAHLALAAGERIILYRFSKCWHIPVMMTGNNLKMAKILCDAARPDWSFRPLDKRTNHPNPELCRFCQRCLKLAHPPDPWDD